MQQQSDDQGGYKSDDQGGYSANEAASFAGISAAKRLCRIMRAVAAAAALPLYCFANGCFAAYTSSPPVAEPLLKEKPLGECTLQLSPAAAAESCTQLSPPWHADGIGAGLAKPDQGENIQVDGWRLRRSGHAEFSLPRGRGGRWPGPLPVFIQLTFTSHIGSLVLS